eukprot:230127-Amphidinium_carterae.1
MVSVQMGWERWLDSRLNLRNAAVADAKLRWELFCHQHAMIAIPVVAMQSTAVRGLKVPKCRCQNVHFVGGTGSHLNREEAHEKSSLI